MIYLIRFQSVLKWYIFLQRYLLHRDPRNGHSVCSTDWRLTSVALWSNSVSVTSHLLTVKRAYANFVVNNGSYHWYLQPSKWQRQLFLLTCFWAHLIDSCVRNIYFTCRPMSIYRMTLVSLRLFRNNLGNLQEFFGRVVHSLPLPRQKMAPTPMISLVSLTRHLISEIQKQLTNCGKIKAVKPLDFQETMQHLISCLFVLWSISVLILTLRRWDIFLSPKSVFVHQWYKLQTCFVKLKLTAIFFSFWSVLLSDVSTNYHCFMRFIYPQDLKVFFISVMVTSVTVFG